MPANPGDGARLAARVADLVAEIETRLLRRMADRLRAGIDAEDWEQQKLAELRMLQQAFTRGVTAADEAVAREILRSIVDANTTGAALALIDLEDAGLDLPRVPDVTPATSIAATVTEQAREALRRVPELLGRTYRQAVSAGVSEVLGGSVTRLQAAQHVLDRLAVQGITGFRDKAGRNWGLTSYVEMAVRTGAGQAAIRGHVDALGEAGIDLVKVSDSPRECPACRPWEGKVLSLTGQVGAVILPDATGGAPVRVDVAGTLDQAKADGLFHPNCFPGDVLVSAPSGVDAADARWYEGDLVVIHTAGGDELPVTPNHPVLTPEGWVAAGALKVGQRLLRYRPGRRDDAVHGPDDEQVPARIGDVFHALRESAEVAAVCVPVAAEQFHGDGLVDTEVEVVLADRLLQRHRAASLLDDRGDGSLFVGGVGLGALLSERTLDQVLVGAGHSADCVVGRGRERRALVGAHAGSAPAGGLVAADRLDAAASHPAGERRLSEADGGRGLALGLLAGEVTLDRVVEVGVRHFAGHVFNLQSGDGWYVASNIVVHNCTHSVSAFIPGATRTGRASSNPDGYEAKQRQRAMERKVREWKRRQAVALDDQAAARAGAKVREWQGALREHVDAHDLKRLRRREQIDQAI